MKSPVKVTARVVHAAHIIKFEIRWPHPGVDENGEPMTEFIVVNVADNLNGYQTLCEVAAALEAQLNEACEPAPPEWLGKPPDEDGAAEPDASEEETLG